MGGSRRRGLPKQHQNETNRSFKTLQNLTLKGDRENNARFGVRLTDRKKTLSCMLVNQYFFDTITRVEKKRGLPILACQLKLKWITVEFNIAFHNFKRATVKHRTSVNELRETNRERTEKSPGRSAKTEKPGTLLLWVYVMVFPEQQHRGESGLGKIPQTETKWQSKIAPSFCKGRNNTHTLARLRFP